MSQIVNPRDQQVDPVENQKELNWNIGTVVTLNSHPFISKNTRFLISGDTSHIPPLMIIVERQENFRKLYDENSGLIIDDFQVKCIYYSSRDHFEEVWLSSKLLKSIDVDPDKDIEALSKIDDIRKVNLTLSKKLVSLKTMETELSKKKSSLRADSISTDARNVRIEGMLTFLSPVMQVIEVKKYDQKEAPFDQKNGKLKKTTPKWVAKCRWFSNDTNKFIERFSPVESLRMIKPVDDSLLEFLDEYIAPRKFLKLKKDNQVSSIIDPKSIVFRNGLYFLNYFDLIFNTFREIRIENREMFEAPAQAIIRETLPNFDFQEDIILSRQSIINELKHGIELASNEKFYIRIKYKNANEQISERTVDNYKIINITEQEGNNQSVNSYLVGYCNLRREERTFRIDRVQRIEILDIVYHERN